MRILGILLLLMTIMFAVSCGDDDETTTGPANIPFSLSLTVTDIGGLAVPNLEIKGKVLLDTTAVPKIAVGKASSALLTPTFRYDVMADSRITYVVYDMNGFLVDTIVDAITVSGSHSSKWYTANVDDGIYACELTATDAGSGALLFSDRVYAAYLPGLLTNTLSPLGYTDASGEYGTTDSLLFPGTFSIPSGMTSTDLFGIELGVFTFPDTVIIVLTDTLLPVTQEFRIQVKPGLNEVSLTWIPPSKSAAFDSRGQDGGNRDGQSASTSSSTVLPDTVWMSLAGTTVRVDSAASDLGGLQIVFDDSIMVTPMGNAARLELGLTYTNGYTKVSIIPYQSVDSVKCFSPGDVLQLSGVANVVHTDVSTCDTIFTPQVMQVVWPGTPEWKLYQNYPNPFF